MAMDLDDYKQITRDIKEIVSDTIKSSILEHIAPVSKRLEEVARKQEECPARRSFSGVWMILGRSLNIFFIALIVYTLKIILRPEVWQFLQTAAGIQ